MYTKPRKGFGTRWGFFAPVSFGRKFLLWTPIVCLIAPHRRLGEWWEQNTSFKRGVKFVAEVFIHLAENPAKVNSQIEQFICGYLFQQCVLAATFKFVTGIGRKFLTDFDLCCYKFVNCAFSLEQLNRFGPDFDGTIKEVYYTWPR